MKADAKADDIVHARLPAEMKDQAVAALDHMGLTVSDLIRLSFLWAAKEGRMPFDVVVVPNRRTGKTMAQLATGKRSENADQE